MSIFDLFKPTNSKLKAELQRLVRNQIEMQTVASGGSLPPDACKIGGVPFLPADFIWPTFTDGESGKTQHLTFFCQLNLAEIAPFDSEKLLPERGLLSFFYGCDAFRWGFAPEDKGAARVFYFEDTSDLVAFQIPEELDTDYVIPELAVAFRAKPSYPSFEEFEVHSTLLCDWEDYDRTLAKLGVKLQEDPQEHKVLGYADVIQNEMLSDCERIARGLFCGNPESYRSTPACEAAEIAKKAGDWTLLLQLGTIETEDFSWMFGDCGMLYYYIRKEDLAEKRFDNSWFSLQCG